MRISPSLTENCFPCVLIVAFISSKGRNKGSPAGVIKALFSAAAGIVRGGLNKEVIDEKTQAEHAAEGADIAHGPHYGGEGTGSRLLDAQQQDTAQNGHHRLHPTDGMVNGERLLPPAEPPPEHR